MAVRDPFHARWPEFYGIYFPFIQGIGRGKGLTHAEAEDLAQHVMIHLVPALPHFTYDESAGGFHSWLFTFTLHRASNFRHKQSNRARLLNEAEQNFSLPLPSPTKAPDFVLSQTEQTLMIEGLLATYVHQKSLQPNHVLALRLALFEQRTNQEIAKAAGLTPGNVAQICWRARQGIKLLYKEEFMGRDPFVDAFLERQN